MAMVGWRMLRAGSGLGAVLSVDFTLAKVRAQANFGDLAPQLPDGYAVWGTDETGWTSAPGAPGAQLERWLHRGGDVDGPVRAVLGFCASASLATALASRLADTGTGAPAVILFDPVPVTARTLVDQAEESMRRLAATNVATSAATEDGTGAGPDPDQDLAELATTLGRRYAERAAAVGAAQSIPSSIVDQLSHRVETNLRFLTLCAAAWSRDRAAPDLLVLSRHHDVPAALPEAPEVRLDVTQNELLSHPGTARAVARGLAAAPANGQS